MHDGMWHFGWMWILWILVVAAVVWAINVALRSAGRGSKDPGEPPEATLKRRYARGEIDKAEYDRLLADIRR